MSHVTEILISASIRFETMPGRPGIYLTAANQLIGEYGVVRRLKTLDRVYNGWEAHHVVEKQDLDQLGVSKKAPPAKSQLSVLLPRAAHVERINNVLRNRNPSRYTASGDELLSAYQEAYSLVGDYSGRGAQNIKNELVAIVKATFRQLGVSI